MSDGNVVELPGPASEARDALTEVLREGAQRLLAQAVEAEVAAFVAEHLHLRDEAGRRVVVRNGHLPERFAGSQGAAGWRRVEHQPTGPELTEARDGR